MFFRYLREHLLDALFVSNVETEMPVIIDFQARRPAAAADDMVSLLGVVFREIGADALARAGDQENLIISGCRFHHSIPPFSHRGHREHREAIVPLCSLCPLWL